MFDPYKSNASILIVDDEPNNLKVLHTLLTERGYDVRAARDGETAIAAAKATYPDLILLDIKMPNMDGYEVCKILKADETVADIPVIFISALNSVEDIVQAFKVGGVDYVTKPFQFDEVLARVNNHLTIVYQQRQLVNQREQIEAMHNRDRERFAKITEMRENFVQSATHDLKNPLAIVMGCADLMKRFDEVRGNIRLIECVESIEESSKEMMNLVTGMLDLIKMQSRLSLDLQEVEFNDFVGEHAAASRMLANERGIELIFNPCPQELVTRLDARLIQRVLANLISNAIKYSPDNSVVEIITLAEDDKAVLHVTDRGFGIDERDIDKVFEPFYRAKKRDGERDIEGTGLGLSIVKEIVEQHRGALQVNSVLGEGSTFSVYLPL